MAERDGVAGRGGLAGFAGFAAGLLCQALAMIESLRVSQAFKRSRANSTSP